ncbi:MAG TPA: hypothetical protein ENH41_04425 [Candidatus Omnitrophica bacterium]|nr:hypothetical protein [Candidatus Omnitrophota bacterium]
MKRRFLIFLSLLLLCNFNLYAFENPFLIMRDNFFREAQELKPLLVKSNDVVLISSMWDSCIMTTTQLDAYFHMINIFNAIDKDDLNEDVFISLTGWLRAIKRTNDLNIKGLNTVSSVSDALTQIHIKKLKGYFSDLNKQVSIELDRISLFEKAVTAEKNK